MNSAAFAQTPTTSLKIVVIEGEDAVNIIQQKTAVAPVIEVRDRNNLPVSGATVTFAVSGNGATFAGGAQTLTVVTNAAGQATAAGLTPTAAGAMQVSATATFQGQTAIATIAQSNVMTAAEAAGTAGATGAGGTGTTTSTTTAAAGGGGGGLSGATIGIIGAAVGGGAVVAKAASGGGSDTPTPVTSTPTTPNASTTTPPTTTPTPTTPTPTPGPASAATYSGPMDGTFNGTSSVTITGGPAESCTFTLRHVGTVTLRLQTTSAGTITGTLDVSGRQTAGTASCGVVSGPIGDTPLAYTANVEGSAGTVRFTQEFRDSQTVEGGSYTTTATTSFTGTVSAGGVTGTLTYNATTDYRGDGFTGRATWTGSIPLTLR
jgi:hypothetical protein